MKNKIKTIQFFIFPLIFFGCFALASNAQADYYMQGTMKSENLLSGATVTDITGFSVIASIPAGTSASVSFSQNRVDFFSSTGTESGWDALSNGTTNVDISGLNWSGGSLFYKLKLETTDPLATPAVASVELTYDGEVVPPAGNARYFEGAMVSTDLLLVTGGELSGSDYFGYAISDMPYGTNVYAQFSIDGITFYNSSGTIWEWDTLTEGDHLAPETAVSLSALNWKGQTSFFYKLKFTTTTDDKTTPTLKKAGLLQFSAEMGGTVDTGEVTVQMGSDSGYCVPGDTPACDPPVLHLKMDEKVSGDAKTLSDISGNGNNGTTNDGANNTGMDCSVRGKYGSACEFDGVDDYVDKLSPSFIGDLAGTISFWVKKTSNGRTDPLIYIGDSGTDNNVFLIRYVGDDYEILNKDTADNYRATYNQGDSTGVWQHIAFAVNSSGNDFYVDGRQVSLAYSSGNASSVDWLDDLVGVDKIRIGADHLSSVLYFSGLIDDVRIYNYARTPAQIAWDYNKGKPIVEWRMDETSGALAHNSIANSLHATLYNMEDGDWVSGKFNNALDFDGSNEYADIGDTNLNINSIGFWINADADTDSIIDLDGGTHTISVSGGTISAGGFSGPTIYVDGAQSSVITAGAWHHILVKTDTAFEASNMDIGRIGTGYFGGVLDEVKIFNYALTAEQVKMEYNGGAVRFSE